MLSQVAVWIMIAIWTLIAILIALLVFGSDPISVGCAKVLNAEVCCKPGTGSANKM